MLGTERLTLFDHTDYPQVRYYCDRTASISTLVSELNQTDLANPDPRELDVVALNPGRLLEAFTNHRISHPQISHDPVVLQTLTEAMVRVHMMDKLGYTQAIGRFEEAARLDRDALEKIWLFTPRELVYDRGYNSKEPEKSYDRLKTKLGDTPHLLLPIGPGGFSAGLDLFARYRLREGDNGSSIYPFRYSIHRHKDTEPHLSPEEVDHLQQQAQDKVPVLFDTVVASGDTLARVYPFFRNTFPQSDVLVMCNEPHMCEKIGLNEGLVRKGLEITPNKWLWEMHLKYFIKTRPFRENIIL